MRLTLILLSFLFCSALLAKDTEALMFARYACEKKRHPVGCLTFGRLLKLHGKNEEAQKAFKKSCTLREKRACTIIETGEDVANINSMIQKLNSDFASN
ncbi:hypothetical protein N9N67_03530 [Bacteriovoracaceae bacterium]|nr:hypothetical protein [Bacteriovoracaceae bacterium]